MRKFSIFFILIIFALTVGLLVGQAMFESKKIQEPVSANNAPTDVLEKTLTKWIYENSSRVSRTDCTAIAVESIKCGKPLLLIALMSAESEFVRGAVSSKGAIGLTQVMPTVWGATLIKAGIIKETRDLYDTAANIRAGSFVLNDCLKQSGGDVTKALEKYLGGRDSFYTKKILTQLGNLYVLTETK